MGLHHFLYRCPSCGHDPLVKEGFRARCPGCLKRFEQGEEGKIRVHGVEGGLSEIPAAELARRLEEMGALSDSPPAENGVILEAPVIARFSEREEPLHFQKQLIGFVERQGRRRPGLLKLTEDDLCFDEGEGKEERWPYLDILALQASSLSIQISPRRGGIMSFRFSQTSTRKWEEALKTKLRAAWRQAGQGDIAEFQPRIRS